jgi:uroporphyrinogen-III synthase
MTTPANFNGATVLALESRRASDMQTLIESFGGLATVAPSIREVPLEHNAELLEFDNVLVQKTVTDLVCMTGVGTKFLLRQLSPEAVTALQNVNLVLRSNKAVAVLREHELTGTLVSEPHTWHEVLEYYQNIGNLEQRKVWIAEFGEDTPKEFVSALKKLGASVHLLPVYRWALPEDTAPLEQAVHGVIAGQFEWLLLTSGVQLWHAVDFARTLGLVTDFKTALEKLRIASIGPACDEAILELGFKPTVQAQPHKMGVLVRVAALKHSEMSV